MNSFLRIRVAPDGTFKASVERDASIHISTTLNSLRLNRRPPVEALKAARAILGMDQRSLGRVVGKATQTVCRYETGAQKAPRTYSLALYALVLNKVLLTEET